MTRKQMKSLAKLQIEGKIGSLFWLSVVASFLGTAAGSLPGVGFVISFVI